LVAVALTEPSYDLASPLEAGASARAGQENSRLQAIAEALPDPHYARAVGLGATHGLPRKLNGRCGGMELVLGAWSGAPAHSLDLIVASDTLLRLSPPERERFLAHAVSALNPGGHLVLAHWLDDDATDELVAEFMLLAETRLLPVSRRKTPYYRIDVLERP
jgi:hypothetical protein